MIDMIMSIIDGPAASTILAAVVSVVVGALYHLKVKAQKEKEIAETERNIAHSELKRQQQETELNEAITKARDKIDVMSVDDVDNELLKYSRDIDSHEN